MNPSVQSSRSKPIGLRSFDRTARAVVAREVVLPALEFRRLDLAAILPRILTAHLEPDHPRHTVDARHDRGHTRRLMIHPGTGAQRDTFLLANAAAADMLALVDAMRDTLSEMGAPPAYAS
jgi:hypothetical protein